MSVFSTLVRWVRTHQSQRAQNLRRDVYTGSVASLPCVERLFMAVAKPGYSFL